MFTQDIPGEKRLVLFTYVARPRITRFEYSQSYAACLCFVANCINTEVQGGAGIVFPSAGGVGGRSGEFLVSKVRCHWKLACHACAAQCVVFIVEEVCWFQAMGGIVVC